MLNTLSTSTPASEISSASFGNDGSYSAEGESKALADILRNSPAAELLGISQESPSDEEKNDSTPEDTSVEQEAQETDESSDNDLDEEKTEDNSDEEKSGDDDTSTNADLPSEEDIDWEYKVPVTVDGKTEYKSLEEIRKGFQTDQHLSQKGRELGELKKQVEQERAEKLQEVITLGTALNEEYTAAETSLANQYQKIKGDIDKAKENGDSYTARELKDELESVQEKYWNVRNKRESQLKAVAEKWQQDNQAQLAEQSKKYSETIKDFIPDYSEKVAVSVRDFAIKEGIPAALLESIYEPAVVKFINDYRKLKGAKETGEVKRKQVTQTKSIPLKNGGQTNSQKKAADSSLRSKVLSGQADAKTQNDFLKSISSIGRKL
jgi:hypothetical protein